MRIQAPAFATIAEYGERLDDVGFWEPYIREILDRHGFGERRLECGFVGTYPTFLADDLVVKLFGRFPGWDVSVATERSMHGLLAEHPEVPAPAVIAEGALFPARPDAWPYLITERIGGVAWRDAALDPIQAAEIAAELGRVSRIVHDLAPKAPGQPRTDAAAGLPGDWAAEHASGAMARQRTWARLDDRLIEAIPAYVAGLPDPAERRILHADLTRDHVFVADGRLLGVIDWGDAMIADRYYELSALHLDLFDRDTGLLRTFLEGYGWQPAHDFEHRALGLALLHRFDVFAGTPVEHDSLPEMASQLFGTEPAARS